MVMEASGSSERKYCQRSGAGQRLTRTSRRLMARSTERPTTTGTNSEPPCCVWGGCSTGVSVACPLPTGHTQPFPCTSRGSLTSKLSLAVKGSPSPPASVVSSSRSVCESGCLVKDSTQG